MTISCPSPPRAKKAYTGSYLAPNGLPWLSVSQVEKFNGCARQWAIRYLGKIKDEDASSLVLGTRVHEIAEAYLKEGARPNLGEFLKLPKRNRRTGEVKEITYYPGQIVHAGVHLLPVPGSAKIEGDFRFSTEVDGDPVYWQGALDMEMPSDALEKRWKGPDVLLVGDHKTSTNIKNYGKTAEPLTQGWEADEEKRKASKYPKPGRLLADPQFNLYAHKLQREHKVSRCGGYWVYYLTDPTKPAEAQAVPVVAESDHVLEQVAKLEKSARVILSLYKDKPDPGTIEPNVSQCDAFGGCPYKDTKYCVLDNRTALSIGDAMSDDFMSAISKLVDAQPAPVRIPPPPPPPPKLTVPPPPPPPPAPAATYNVVKASQGDNPWGVQQLAPAIGTQPVNGQSEVSSIEPDAEAMEALKGYMRDAMKLSEDKIEEYTRPKVEHGFINSPEGPEFPIASPEELAPVVDTKAEVSTDSLDSMDRDALKAFAVHLGVVQANARFQAPKLKELIRGVTGYVGALETYQAGVGVAVPAGAVEALVAKMAEKLPPFELPVGNATSLTAMFPEAQTNVTLENDGPAPGVEPVTFESSTNDVSDALTKIAEALEAIRKVMSK